MINKYNTFLIILILIPIIGWSQPKANYYIDFGEHQASGGFYAKNTLIFKWPINKYKLTIGTQTNLINTNHRFFSGFKSEISRTIKIQDEHFDIGLMYLYLPFSQNIHESDIGIIAQYCLNKFDFALGSNYRQFKITKQAQKNYNINNNITMPESLNLMYSVAYNINKKDNRWNLGIQLTNIDNFTIYQETNPILNLNGTYKFTSSLTVFSEIWYKTAGALNLHVNYFGYLIRTGIIWQINY